MRSRDLLDMRAVYFMAVVEEGSFSAAARRLMVTQSAVSQQVAQLEGQLKVKLLDRSGYRPVPTPEGKQLYRALTEADRVIGQATNLLDATPMNLTVGFTGAAQNRGLLDFVQRYRSEHPDIDISFRKASFDGGRELLLNGQVDCCFGIPTTYDGLRNVVVQPLYEYQLCVICSHDNPLASRDSVTPSDLVGLPFIVLSPEYGRDFYHTFMNSLRADGVRPRIAKAVDSFDELVLDVSIGEGVALVASEVVNEREVAVLPLAGSNAHSSYVVARLTSNQNPALLGLIDAAKAYFGAPPRE